MFLRVRLDEGQKGLKRDNDVDSINIWLARILSRHNLNSYKNLIKIDETILECLPYIISIRKYWPRLFFTVFIFWTVKNLNKRFLDEKKINVEWTLSKMWNLSTGDTEKAQICLRLTGILGIFGLRWKQLLHFLSLYLLISLVKIL